MELTLTPNTEETPAASTAAVAAAVAESPAAAAAVAEAPSAAVLEMAKLTEEEQKQVNDFSKTIDISNAQQILQYGAGAQKNISQFSEAALSAVRTKDLGEVGGMISDLVVELKGFDADEESKGFLGIFKKANKNLESMKAKYAKAETNVDKIASKLEGHQITLMKDVAVMDEMYEKNLEYYKELTMYILAGKQKLEYERNTTLVELRRRAQESGLAEDAQRANDYDNLCLRFERKLHDLELTRTVSMQMGPQIRLIQNNDTLMSEKIQTSLVNTIPLWKSQMVLTLGINHSQQAVAAQRQVTNITNELLKKNSEMLKTATIETAKEAERSIVDIETLKITNQNLISTLDEVLEIQTEGKRKRAEAEVELRKIESELKEKLLEIRN